MFNLGFGELAVIVVVALIFLGPKLLPEIATGLGKVIREIRKATADVRRDVDLDDMIRGPLRELRDAATLPPEELKRQDEVKAARRKAEAEAAERRQREAREAEEEQRRKAKEAEQARLREQEAQATLAAAAAPPLPAPAEVISAGGTMIANPPPTDELRTLTPLPELQSPPPLVSGQPHLPAPPPLPPAKPAASPDATVVDLQAQLKAAAEAKTTLAGRPAPISLRPPLYRPPGDRDKKG
ncbi:MAG: twin-arginine translocase TatA/TatE family subunit [Deltaproteobacteria bacterium]|nr:twin-arginine translocase TatA/TatE family subunit [Deltaproteobacteria bacterium]